MPLAAKCRSSNSSPRKNATYMGTVCITFFYIFCIFLFIFFGGLDGRWLLLCFAYVTNFCIWRDFWIRSAAVASRRAINLAHLSPFVECSFLRQNRFFSPALKLKFRSVRKYSEIYLCWSALWDCWDLI
jgi:hypothetical protein